MNAKVLKIGNVELDSPFLLAPMAGITDGPVSPHLPRNGGRACVLRNGECKGALV